jgi:hypothetical protein
MNELYVDSIGPERYKLCDAGGCDARLAGKEESARALSLIASDIAQSAGAPRRAEREGGINYPFLCSPAIKTGPALNLYQRTHSHRRARFAAGAFNRASVHKLITLRVQICTACDTNYMYRTSSARCNSRN